MTSDRSRRDGVPILLGTTCWTGIEHDGGPFLLVDRCQYGDANKWVSIGWNGRGRRADFRVPPNPSADRWERYGLELTPWREGGDRIVLCGQVGSFSPRWASERDWYANVAAECTHFRPHPAQPDNPTRLPTTTSFSETRAAVVLNSSVAVYALIRGIPVVTQDEGSMAWDVTGHTVDDVRQPERLPWCHWLAWCQWSHDEISEGVPWAYLW